MLPKCGFISASWKYTGLARIDSWRIALVGSKKTILSSTVYKNNGQDSLDTSRTNRKCCGDRQARWNTSQEKTKTQLYKQSLKMVRGKRKSHDQGCQNPKKMGNYDRQRQHRIRHSDWLTNLLRINKGYKIAPVVIITSIFFYWLWQRIWKAEDIKKLKMITFGFLKIKKILIELANIKQIKTAEN